MTTKFETIVAVLLALLAGALIGAVSFPMEVTKEVQVNKTVTVPVETIVEVEKLVEVEKEVIVNQTVEVPVDNGKLDLVLKHIYDNEGKIEYIVDDLDDDELSEITDRIVFVNEIKKLAVDAVKDELADELDRKKFNETEFDEDDIEKLRIDSDDDEVEVLEADFEDKDADVKVTGTFEHEDVKYNFEAIVEFKDDQYDELSVEVSLD